MMNRRDFLKGAVLLPNLLALLPVLARSAQPPIAPVLPFRFADGDGLVVLETVQMWFEGSGSLRVRGKTSLGYAGTYDRLKDLGGLLRKECQVESGVFERTVTSTMADLGLVQTVWESDWAHLKVRLRGLWQCNLGIVPAGETGLEGLVSRLEPVIR